MAVPIVRLYLHVFILHITKRYAPTAISIGVYYVTSFTIAFALTLILLHGKDTTWNRMSTTIFDGFSFEQEAFFMSGKKNEGDSSRLYC